MLRAGISAAGRLLTSAPVRNLGRQAVQGLGQVAMNSVRNIAGSVQRGAPFNRPTIVRGIAGSIGQTLGGPNQLNMAVRRNRAYWHMRCRRMGYVRPRYRAY